MKLYQGSVARTLYISDAAVFHAGQLASIFLPTPPDATLGQYYRLDWVEDGHLMFEREMSPKADVPYLIIPDKDFRIAYGDMDNTGRFIHQSLPEASFYGFYSPYVYTRYERETTFLVDKTSECYYLHGGKHSSSEYGASIGAMRALITLQPEGDFFTNVDWESFSVSDDRMKILVFHDGTTDRTFSYNPVEALTAPRKTSFAGIVFNQEDIPVAGARVKVKSVDGKTEYEARTDDLGHFLLPIDDKDKLYEVSISAEGYPEQQQYRDGWQPFDFSRGSLADIFYVSNKAVFKANRQGSIILPTTPDPSLGKYYGLEKVQDGKAVFRIEPSPKANVPYLIVPNKDFEIDLHTVEQHGVAGETAVQGARLRGFYEKSAYKRTENEYLMLLDKTASSDNKTEREGCDYVFEHEDSRIDIGCIVGAMHAVLVMDDSEYSWADYNVVYHWGNLYELWKDRLLEFRDETTGVNSIEGSPFSYHFIDLFGRRLTVEPQQKGVYIRGGRKYVRK